MMDWVLIDNLCLPALIGVYDYEQTQAQTIRLDIEMQFDTRKAAASDKLGDALDYHAVIQRIERIVEKTHYQLIESLAEHIANMILDEFATPLVRIKLAKLDAIEQADSVGISIERHR